MLVWSMMGMLMSRHLTLFLRTKKTHQGTRIKNWLDVGMACKNAGLPVEAWIDWSRASKDFDENENKA